MVKYFFLTCAIYYSFSTLSICSLSSSSISTSVRKIGEASAIGAMQTARAKTEPINREAVGKTTHGFAETRCNRPCGLFVKACGHAHGKGCPHNTKNRALGRRLALPVFSAKSVFVLKGRLLIRRCLVAERYLLT